MVEWDLPATQPTEGGGGAKKRRRNLIQFFKEFDTIF